MSTFDLSRPYTTRDGRKAFATVGPDGRLYGWAVEPGGEGIDSESWNADGTYFSGERSSSWDLVNPDVPVYTLKTWFNVYKHEVGCDHFLGSSCISRKDADTCSTALDATSRIACIEREISYVLGEGLNQP